MQEGRNVQASDDEGSPMLSEHRGGVLILTLNRPQRMNAVSPPMYQAIEQAIRNAEHSETTRAIVVTGAGRAFSVGADLKSHGTASPTAEECHAYAQRGQQANAALQSTRVPVVAAVNGHAIGAGLELALSADLIVVAEQAKLRFPEVALGTSVGGGVSYTLSARVGRARARELLLLAPFFSGADAAAMGLANRALPSEEVLDGALGMAKKLEAMAPQSLRGLRQLLRLAEGGVPPDRMLAEEAEALVRCVRTRDWAEGIQAFEENRAPSFEDR